MHPEFTVGEMPLKGTVWSVFPLIASRVALGISFSTVAPRVLGLRWVPTRGGGGDSVCGEYLGGGDGKLNIFWPSKGPKMPTKPPIIPPKPDPFTRIPSKSPGYSESFGPSGPKLFRKSCSDELFEFPVASRPGWPKKS